MSTFERLTLQLRHALRLAHEEAELMQHNWIGTGHVLLGTMHEVEGHPLFGTLFRSESTAARVLRDLGLKLSQVRKLVEHHSHQGRRDHPNGEFELTWGTQQVLTQAVRMARHYIDTGHVLLALRQYDEGMAARILNQLEITLEDVQRELHRVQEEASSPLSTTNQRVKQLAQLEKIQATTRSGALRESGIIYLGDLWVQILLSKVITDEVHSDFELLDLERERTIRVKEQIGKLQLTLQQHIESLGRLLTQVEISEKGQLHRSSQSKLSRSVRSDEFVILSGKYQGLRQRYQKRDAERIRKSFSPIESAIFNLGNLAGQLKMSVIVIEELLGGIEKVAFEEGSKILEQANIQELRSTLHELIEIGQQVQSELESE